MTKALAFYKYQGTGNDFILLDNRSGSIRLTTAEIAFLCHRRFGIGADGLMLLQSVNGFDFEMVYYNADGNIGSMCGNGGRCIVAFAHRLGLFAETTRFLAVDGTHFATIQKNGTWVKLQMKDVDKIERLGDDFVLDTGSPHYVRMVPELDTHDVYREGQRIRNSTRFVEQGINVNFVQTHAKGFSVRTYERGVEDETLACGTGVTAVAMAMAYEKPLSDKIETTIQVPGGELKVSFNQRATHRFTEVFLEGPARFVFEGTIVL